MSLPPAYTSQPPIVGSLPANSSNQPSLSSLPPYSAEPPPNHVTVPHPYVGATVPNVSIRVNSQPPYQPQVVQHVQPHTPPAITPQATIPQSYTQMIQQQPHPHPQPQVPQPLPYSAPYYLINGIPSGPVLPTGPVYGSISYPYSLYPSPYLQARPQTVHPYTLTYPTYPPQVPVPFQQPPPMTHQGGIFQENGYPGPGSLPPGGRWAVTTDDGKRTLWTIMPGETRPGAWAYPGDAT
ncbi:hypothetical protein DL95DRAFT_457876 [Leptodontidium sp. 2 PMI_412]|nr:hypothetical protein BKA61DRAFT_614277 [Leptodontidium sp. MPI-SDFR-AT-0119]KAH9219047.1 hypothetical protein DL95DRAFT_457876 [Leptodontidium sp. 2 PMI_412]